MLKEITKVKVVINGREEYSDDDASKFLTFSYWTAGEKHRIYINDYNRRTLGYIDLDDNENVIINSNQGLNTSDINATIDAFFTEYSEEEAEECDFLFGNGTEVNEEAAPIWEEIEHAEEEQKAIRNRITAFFEEFDHDEFRMTETDKAALSALYKTECNLLKEEIELYKKLHECVGNIFIVEYQCNLETLINKKQKMHDLRTGKED